MDLEQRIADLEDAISNLSVEISELRAQRELREQLFSTDANIQPSKIEGWKINKSGNAEFISEAMEKAAIAGADAAMRKIHQDFASCGPLRRLIG